MKLPALMLATVMACSPALAKDVTFIIPGGTKGVFMGQAVSHTEDLTRLGYTADIGAPGNTCGAAELINNSDHPTLFVWGSDSEASAIMGDGCVAPEFTAEDVVAVTYNPVFLCTLDPALDPLSGEHKLGIWLSTEAVHAAAVDRLNTVAGSNLSPVPYDGSGSALTALTNGEVDVALLPRTRAAKVKESGGACDYMFANPGLAEGVNSLVEMYGEPALNLTSMDIIVAKGWDDKSVLSSIYNDSTSSVSQNPDKFDSNVPAEVMMLWGVAVRAFVFK